MQAADDLSARLVAEIAASAKYRQIARETIEDVVAGEIRRAASGDASRVEQLARKRLHEVASLYLGTPRLAAAKRRLQEAFADGTQDAVEAACRSLLGVHASTRERLPIVDRFYRTLFSHTGPPRVLADLAAALGPLAFRFMGLPETTRYLAYDIHSEFVALIGHYFSLEAVDGAAIQRDVLVRPPEEPADVALLLKMFHCLEKRRAGAGVELLAAIPAHHVAVSLPTRTMSGRRAPFVAQYAAAVRELASERAWPVAELPFEGELCLVVCKPEHGARG